MLSRLKSLELQGYKTFANRTVFEFPGAVTAIVGPNGSGKSNITDALRWVLGEQSYSLLRGKKTEDMIFAGSDRRTRSGMASATVIFDNSDNWLPIDFTEVAIARRAYRDGSNEYLLNGQRVRLKDVSELLAESGLAERTYTIIGQGLVDAALALRAEDRRRLFEEAAGIGLHRSRRQEAVRRMQDTHRNLERVEDILAELKPRLRSLERQARRAQEYDQAVADLRSLLREWYGYHWHLVQKELSLAQEQAKEKDEALGETRQKEFDLEADIALLRGKRQEIRDELNKFHRHSAELHSKRENTSRQLAVAEERTRYIQEQSLRVKADLSQTEEVISMLEARTKFAQDEMERLETELNEAKERGESVKESFELRQAKREKIEAKLTITRDSFVEITARRSNLKALHSDRQAQAESLQKSIINADKALGDGKESLLTLETKVENSRIKLNQAEENIREIESARNSNGQEILKQTKQRQELLNELARLEASAAKFQAQFDVLQQAKRSYAGYSSGAKALLEGIKDVKIKGSRGMLGGILDVPEKYEIAIGAVLGDYLDAIILEDQSEIEGALSFLEEISEKAAILPLDAIVSYKAELAISDKEKIIGIASEMVSVPSELKPAIELLLRDVVIVQDRKVAYEVLNLYRRAANIPEFQNVRLVTLKGEVFHALGPIKTSSSSKPVSLSRRREEREISEKLDVVRQEIKEINGQISEVEGNLSSLTDEGAKLENLEITQRKVREDTHLAHSQNSINLEQLKREIQWQKAQISQFNSDLIEARDKIKDLSQELSAIEQSEKVSAEEIDSLILERNELPLDNLQTDLAHWTTRIAVLEQALGEAGERLAERKQSQDDAKLKSATIKENIAELLNNQDEVKTLIESLQASNSDTDKQIDSTRELIIPAEKELEIIEHKLTQQQSIESKERQVSNQAEHNYTQARINQVRKQEALDTMRRQIEVDFGLVAFEYIEDVSGPNPLPLEGFVEELPIVDEISSETEKALNRQRALLRRIGPINPEAQTEYQEVDERYEFLTSQVSDLKDAAEDVDRVIQELDEIMEREFCNTFEAVAEEFHQIFSRLFGGGSARLVLTDPNELTDTGIDIEARLPGRREQGLSLLSGGERSLTAVALVFALLRVSPTPFCVLDEVDAMLDEANVGRFRELLRELSQSTQFVMITHNRASVQVADIIYGVTMGRDSTSQILSLKVDELEKVV